MARHGIDFRILGVSDPQRLQVDGVDQYARIVRVDDKYPVGIVVRNVKKTIEGIVSEARRLSGEGAHRIGFHKGPVGPRRKQVYGAKVRALVMLGVRDEDKVKPRNIRDA